MVKIVEFEELLEKAVRHHEHGEILQSEKFYNLSLNINPDSFLANKNLGILYFNIGKFDKAMFFTKRALELDVTSKEIWKNYLIIVNRLDEPVLMEAAIKRANLFGLNVHLETNDKTEKYNKIRKQTNYLKTLVKLINDNEILKVKEFCKSINLSENEIPTFKYLLGKLHLKNKEYLQAEQQFREAIKLDLTLSDAYKYLGITYRRLNDVDKAIVNFEKALETDPHNKEVLLLLGTTQLIQKLNQDAIRNLEKYLNIDSDNFKALNNLGTAHLNVGDIDKAEVCFRLSLEKRHDNASAHYNLGSILQTKGQKSEAIYSYSTALNLNPNLSDVFYNMGSLLKNFAFDHNDPNLQPILLQFLTTTTNYRPRSICSALLGQCFHDNEFLNIVTTDISMLSVAQLQDIIKRLSNMSVFIELLKVTPIPNLEIEKFLIALRAKILSSVHTLKSTEDLLAVQSALAIQNFLNGYIHYITDEENKLIKILKESVLMSGSYSKENYEVYVASIASYEPLNSKYDHESLRKIPQIRDIFVQHIDEPMTEAVLRKDIRSLKTISNKISLSVQEQYEEYPYPRWSKLRLPKVRDSLTDQFGKMGVLLYDRDILGKQTLKVLIAGCGTGEHAITKAALYENATITAIDLSRSSLAYAIRKSKELGINNIKFLQADILDLDQLNEKFDIIECVGVLHHMEEPMRGWAVLYNILNPGGLMKIGLYSNSARQDISKARQFYIHNESDLSPDNIRKYRHEIIESGSRACSSLSQFTDFYSTNEVKDLIFHIQEHQYTLDEINKSIKSLSLEFCGFEAEFVKEMQSSDNAENSHLYDLHWWSGYETEFPTAFSEMYQFWCQKI